LFLTNFASKSLVHRRDTLRAEAILIDRLIEKPENRTALGSTSWKKSTAAARSGLRTWVKARGLSEISDIAARDVFILLATPLNEVEDVLETHMGGYVVTKPDSTETSMQACSQRVI
jgi:thioredoxin reductase (NADPH)